MSKDTVYGCFMRGLTGFFLGAAIFGFATAAPASAQDGRGRGGDFLRAGPNGNFLNVIVVLDEDFGPGRGAANQAEAARVARSLGVSPRRAWGHALFGCAASVPQSRLDALRNDPRVAYVEIDELNSIPTPPPPSESTQEVPRGIARVGGDVNPKTGLGVHVYIIDSGIDTDHEDLGNLDNNNSYAAVNCSPVKKCKEPWDDYNGHGSHVAGTVGAENNSVGVIGVAPLVPPKLSV